MSSNEVNQAGSAAKVDPNAIVKSGPTNKASTDFDPNQKLSSSTLGALQKEAPEVYEMLKKTIADKIRTESEKHNRKMKEINREARRFNS